MFILHNSAQLLRFRATFPDQNCDQNYSKKPCTRRIIMYFLVYVMYILDIIYVLLCIVFIFASRWHSRGWRFDPAYLRHPSGRLKRRPVLYEERALCYTSLRCAPLSCCGPFRIETGQADVYPAVQVCIDPLDQAAHDRLLRRDAAPSYSSVQPMMASYCCSARPPAPAPPHRLSAPI